MYELFYIMQDYAVPATRAIYSSTTNGRSSTPRRRPPYDDRRFLRRALRSDRCRTALGGYSRWAVCFQTYFSI